MNREASDTKSALRSRLVAIAAGAGAVAYVFLVFLPGQSAIARMDKEAREKQRQIVAANLLALPLEKLRRDVASTEQFVADWRRDAAAGNHVSHCVGEMIRHAKAHRVSILRLEPQAEQPFAALQPIPVNVRVEGDFAGIHGLLQNLDFMNKAVWVEQLEFENGGTDQLLRCNLKLIIFSDRAEISG